MSAHRRRRARSIAAVTLITLAIVGAACGGASAKSSSSPTAADGASDAGHGDGGRFGGTPPAAIQTAIAQGTRPAFGDRTFEPDAAGGTPHAGFGERTASPEFQTAIAQGTPASALRLGLGGGGRALSAAATVLGIDAQQLRTELQADGASLDSIAAARGMDRATLRQKLLDAVRGQVQQAVAAGTLQQAAADQAVSDFESNIDSVIDRVGGDGFFDEGAPDQ